MDWILALDYDIPGQALRQYDDVHNNDRFQRIIVSLDTGSSPV